MTKRVAPDSPIAEVDLDAVRERVFAEAKRFRAEIPALLPIYAERWVVFRDGEVSSAHDAEELAYVAGLERFGPYGGHVIAIVREPEIISLSALTAFGL